MSTHKAERRRPELLSLVYQHPEVAELKVASPTLSRLGKMFTLQWASIVHAGLE